MNRNSATQVFRNGQNAEFHTFEGRLFLSLVIYWFKNLVYQRG